MAKKNHQTLVSALFELLSDNGYHTISEVADHLNRSKAIAT